MVTDAEAGPPTGLAAGATTGLACTGAAIARRARTGTKVFWRQSQMKYIPRSIIKLTRTDENIVAFELYSQRVGMRVINWLVVKVT
jgi:hypothetical protein